MGGTMRKNRSFLSLQDLDKLLDDDVPDATKHEVTLSG